MNAGGKLAKFYGLLIKVALVNPRRLSHVFGAALAAAEEVEDRSCDLRGFTQVRVEDLLPDQQVEVVEVALFPPTESSISPFECVALILLMRRAKAKTVFEFGTYRGVSTTQLALTVADGGQVYTLDLPEDDPRTARPITGLEDRKIAQEGGKGRLVPLELRDRIQFLKQDSATFDETPYLSQMDFVFVDGAHNTDYVRNDSEKGWRMLRPGGIIAWHDCRMQDPEVVRYLLGSEYGPKRILNTSLAFSVKSPATG